MERAVQQRDKVRPPQSETKEDIVSWFSALKQPARGALRIDRSKITAGKALRSMIAYALPLALGVGTGHVLEGVLITAGAALLGTVGLTYTQRARTRTLLLACVGIALSAFVGTTTGNITWLAILLIGVWGFGAGLLVSISQPAMIIGLQSTLALIIFSHYATDPAHAALEATLLFAGALLQTFVALIPLPMERTASERSALSSVYQKLAAYAVDPSDEKFAAQLRDTLQQTYATLSDTNLHTRQGKVLFGLLEEAEHIRLTIIMLTKLHENLAEQTTSTCSLAYLERVRQATGEELRAIARNLKSTGLSPELPLPYIGSRRGESSSFLPEAHQELKDSLTALRREAPITDQNETVQHILTYCDALHGQLHTAHKLAQAWRNKRQDLPIQVHVPQQQYLQLHNAQATLRANLSFHSTAFRHAVRLGVALIIASILEHLVPLPLERGYWIPLTLLIILRPDFITTFTRGVARFLGTILGVVLAGLLISLIAPSQPLLAVLSIVTVYLAFSLLYVNYALFTLFITMEVVFLLTFVLPQPITLADSRAIATTIGGILALLVYVLWPTWERLRLADNLASRLDALRNYVNAVLTGLADPSTYNDLSLNSRRMDSRLARSNAEASLQNALREPQRHRVDVNLAEGLLGAADSIIQSILTLEAYLIDTPERHPLPMIRPFASTIDEALRKLTTAIRQDQPVAMLPTMQQALYKLEHELKAEQLDHPKAGIDQHLIISQCKRTVHSIMSIDELLGTKWSKTGGATLSPAS